MGGFGMRVSRGLRLFVVTIAAALGSIGAAQAAQASTLHYYGGPVSHSMKVYVVDWGAGVRSTYTDTATGVPGLFSYLAGQSGSTSGIGGVLAQYMDTSGANSQNRISYAGLRTITPPSGSVIQDSQITSTLQSAIGSSALPAPSGDGMSTIYVVLFPPNVNVCEGGSCAYSSGGFCAYHGSVALSSSTHALYAAMVDNGPGTPNFGLCGPSSNDVSNETDVVSHEFSEAVNDPLVAEAPGYSPPLAQRRPGRDRRYLHRVKRSGQQRPVHRPEDLEQPRQQLRGRRIGLQRPHGGVPGQLHRGPRPAGHLQRRRLHRPFVQHRLGLLPDEQLLDRRGHHELPVALG
jgi:hypothetical protein